MRIFSTALLLLSSLAATSQTSSLTLSQTIPLPGVAGKFDHFAIDTAGHRLFIAATGNHSVEVIDLKTAKVEQSIAGLGKPHGLVWDEAAGSLYVADGTLAELRLYKGSPFKLAGSIKLSDDADDMVFDEPHHLLYVGHGGGSAAAPGKVAVIDTAKFALLANLGVASHPEALDFDSQGRRVFANIADSAEVAVINGATNTFVAHWKLIGAADNVPMAYDSGRKRLYVACRTPATVLALDASTGAEIGRVTTGDGADDLFYDAAQSRLYVISGAGEVDVIKVDGGTGMSTIGVIHTAAGAKTALFVPAENNLYVGVPGTAAKPAEIRVYSTAAQDPAPSTAATQGSSGTLKYVVIVSRHGVRSPTGKTDTLNQYSAKPWPQWSVPPGYLTEHGVKLMTLFGAYDREMLAKEGLFASDGCGDASRVTIIADSDQRTRETGNALAAGMFPACNVDVKALPEGTPDPLFHSLEAGVGHADKAIATAAIAGRIGNNPAGLTEAYRPQLQALEDVLQGCNPGPACASAHSSLFDIPSSIGPGKGDHLVELRSPLGTAATMAENLLLEYTEGMDASQVGWGRVDANKLRELMQLHTANAELERRTSYIARAGSSNLLAHILNSMKQATSGKPVDGALGKPEDRLLILVGHDTNLSNISGALGLTWLIDGRLDDTPPGGAIVFELWKQDGSPAYSVHASYTAQSLDQMRNATPLSLTNPPERLPVFVPGCSHADQSCDWVTFKATMQSALELQFTN